MLSNAQPVGIDLLGGLASVAAERAATHHGTPVIIIRCDGTKIDSDLAHEHHTEHEAWLVRVDEGESTFTAFATIREPSGKERIAAAGRFTFSALPSVHGQIMKDSGQ